MVNKETDWELFRGGEHNYVLCKGGVFLPSPSHLLQWFGVPLLLHYGTNGRTLSISFISSFIILYIGQVLPFICFFYTRCSKAINSIIHRQSPLLCVFALTFLAGPALLNHKLLWPYKLSGKKQSPASTSVFTQSSPMSCPLVQIHHELQHFPIFTYESFCS